MSLTGAGIAADVAYEKNARFSILDRTAKCHMTDLKDDKRFANTLARGLNVLRAFGPADSGLTNLELSKRSGIPRSTISRLTFTLCTLGYLTHGRHHDLYRLGPASLALGNIASATFAFVDAARPIMQTLADQTGTLIGVAVHDEGKMLMVKTWRPVGSPTNWLDVGFRMPIQNSSTGAGFLGAMTDKEFAKLITRQPQLDAKELSELMLISRQQVSAQGFAYVEAKDRFTKSMNAVAAPYRPTEFGEPVTFLSGATSDALTEAMIKTSVGPALAKAVKALQRVAP